MATPAAKTIALPPDSELAAVIAEVSSSGAPLIVEAGRSSYQLQVRPVRPSGESLPENADEPVTELSPAELYRAITEQRDMREVLRRLAVDAEPREVVERLEARLRA